MKPTRRPHPEGSTHPLVIGAAVLAVVAAAGIGIWIGSPRAPEPDPALSASRSVETFLPASSDSAEATASPDEDRGAVLFRERCAGCHTIGEGDLAGGPDLARAALGRDRAWLRAMVTRPDSMFRADSLAQWVLEVHDIPASDATAADPDLRALADFFASFDRGL